MTDRHDGREKTILDSINEGVFTVDLDWKITEFNRAAEHITRVSRREALGQLCCEVFRASICENACVLRRTMSSGKPIQNATAHIITRRGELIPIRISTALLKDENGQIIGGVETFQDLSPIEQLQKELKSRYTFQDIVGRSPAMVKLFEILPQISESSSTVLIEGPSGTGKRTTITQFLDKQAADESIPLDLCYVNNFEQPHKPRALRLPPGQGAVLRQDMEQLIEELRAAIPAAFESEDYRTRRQKTEDEFKELQGKAFTEIQQHAQEQSIALIRTSTGLALAPMQEGEVISPDEFHELPEKARKQFEGNISKLQDQLQETLHQARQWEREALERIKELDRIY